MRFGRNSLLIMTLLSISSAASANNKTLFVNGVNAAVHGDIGLDKGEWRNQQSYSALRLKAGFQLIRVDFVGLTIGFQKVGYYTAQKNWDEGSDNKTHFDYRGPVEELHLFPEAMFGFSVAAHQGTGFSFTEGDSAADFGVTCESPCQSIKTERSRITVNELSAQVNYLFKPGLQFFLGAGTRHVVGRPQYAVFRTFDATNAVGDFWESRDKAKWTMDNQFYLIGLRGTTL